MWLAGVGTFVLVILLGLLLTSRSLPTAACAAAGRPVAAPVAALPARLAAAEDGWASRYTTESGDCARPLPGNGLFVAVSTEEYDDGAACGGYLDVEGPKGSVRVMVTDECGCDPGHMQLSPGAWDRIADGDGEVDVFYQQAVNPPLPGPLTVFMKDTISPDWFEAQIRNHGNPLTSVQVRSDGDSDWQDAKHEFWGFWTIWGGAGPGPFDIKVSDGYGHHVILENIRLQTNSTQRTSVYMYGTSTASKPRTTRPGTPTRSPSASPSSSGTASPTPTASATTAAPPSDEPIVPVPPDPDTCRN